MIPSTHGRSGSSHMCTCTYNNYAGDTDVCRSDQTISRGWNEENKDITWSPQEVRCAWESSHHTQLRALHQTKILNRDMGIKIE